MASDHPDFCADCWKVGDCKQKQYMFAGTEPVSGFTSTELCDHICADCADGMATELHPLDYEELDSPAHCCDCGIPLRHQLTTDGAQYVKEAIAGDAGCCREVWPTVWADYLE